MHTQRRSVFSRHLLFIISIFLLLFTTISISQMHPLYAQIGTEIVVEEPTLTPPYFEPCSGWYRFMNDRGYYAYLTLNTNLPSESSNWGRWQPNLPLTGDYRVEALIANHDSIYWGCGVNQNIDWDTSDARYHIQHRNGGVDISLSQRDERNKWIVLGTYPFSAGNSGWVELRDLNGEPRLTRTVSFSAMRFVLVSLPPTPTFTATPVPPTTVTPTPSVPPSDSYTTYLPINVKLYRPMPCLDTEVEPNNASANALQRLPLCQSVVLRGTLPVGDPDDYYRIQLNNESVVTVDLFDMTPGSDFDLYLYDENLETVAISRNSGTANEQITPRIVSAGTYYIRIYPNPNVTGGARTYALRWTR